MKVLHFNHESTDQLEKNNVEEIKGRRTSKCFSNSFHESQSSFFVILFLIQVRKLFFYYSWWWHRLYMKYLYIVFFMSVYPWHFSYIFYQTFEAISSSSFFSYFFSLFLFFFFLVLFFYQALSFIEIIIIVLWLF